MFFLFWSSKSTCHADTFEHPASLNKITLFLPLGDLGFLDLAGERGNLIKGCFQFLLKGFDGHAQLSSSNGFRLVSGLVFGATACSVAGTTFISVFSI